MNNVVFLYCFLLCVCYILLTVFKVGLNNKSYILPSTFFAVGWAIASLGCYLYSNGILEMKGKFSFVTARSLSEIGSYQFNILLVSFLAFLSARIVCKKNCFESPLIYSDYEVPFIKRKLRIFLILFFIFGSIRLISVLSSVGFNYANIRDHYLGTRAMFGTFDTWLIRICSYLSVLSIFYVSLVGYEMAIKGIKYKELITTFLLFCPFQMSFGGRLFVLSFFLPFLFSFFSVLSIARLSKKKQKKAYRKIFLIVLLPIVLLIVFESLKMGDSISDAGSYVEEVFYPAASYIHMNELWDAVPDDFELGYGVNMLGSHSDTYKKIEESWSIVYNSASVCTPSVIPEIYFDFGEYFSYVVYFVLFFLMERHSMKIMSNLTLSGFFLFIEYCFVSFQTTVMSAFDVIRALAVVVIMIYIIPFMKGFEHMSSKNYKF